MKYNVMLGKSKKEFVINTPIDIDGVLLMIADNYGDEWYGCCVSCKETNSFICNAVESYYTGVNEDGSINKYYDFPNEYRDRTVKDWAIERYCDSLKYKNGHYTSSYDYREDSEVYHITKNIFTEQLVEEILK